MDVVVDYYQNAVQFDQHESDDTIWKCTTQNCEGVLPKIEQSANYANSEPAFVCSKCETPIQDSILPKKFIDSIDHHGSNQMDQYSYNESYYIEKLHDYKIKKDYYRISVYSMNSDYFDYEYTKFMVKYYPFNNRWFVYQASEFVTEYGEKDGEHKVFPYDFKFLRFSNVIKYKKENCVRKYVTHCASLNNTIDINSFALFKT